jgi:hypothetical protein
MHLPGERVFLESSQDGRIDRSIVFFTISSTCLAAVDTRGLFAGRKSSRSRFEDVVLKALDVNGQQGLDKCMLNPICRHWSSR